jgi:hypothetical protein
VRDSVSWLEAGSRPNGQCSPERARWQAVGNRSPCLLLEEGVSWDPKVLLVGPEGPTVAWSYVSWPQIRWRWRR